MNILSPYPRRQAARNPLEPYSWEARYYGGGKLQQFDLSGYHNAHEIELPRLESLAVLGHPWSPIIMPRPYDKDRPLKQVLMYARNTITFGAGRPERAVEFYQIGYIYESPEEEFFARFYPDGKVFMFSPMAPNGVQMTI